MGDEMLRGDRTDSHARHLGRRLLEIGARLDRVLIVGDRRGEIADAVRERHRGAEALVITGGLGPTHDDVTREGVADALGLPLAFDASQWEWIQGYFHKHGREASESNRRQAMFPRGATPIENTRGTAPGFLIDAGGCLLAALPGPPREFRAMLDSAVIPRLQRRFGRSALLTRTFRTMGVGESQMAALLEALSQRYDEFTLASLPHVAGVDLILRARPGTSDAALCARADAFEAELASGLGEHRGIGEHIYAVGERTLEETVGEKLVRAGATVAVAESLTGGLLAKRLTDVPGSSRYFLAGVTAYSNESKEAFLGVKRETLEAWGAVSEAVCREMAEGVRARTGAAYGMATTGIAGPDGATPEKPLGLCYYGVAGPKGTEIRKRVFGGGREDVRERAVWAALFLLYETLR